MAESIRETMVQYPSDKVTMRAFAAAPHTKERRPAIILVQEWWGLTDHIKDVACRYAAEGYVAIAPDLYSRLGNARTTDPAEAGKLMNTLKQEDGLTDLNATVAYLKTVPEVDAKRIGVTGFCMGGSYALMLPCVNSGTYGICESCGEEISIKRLKARPVTTQWIECKAKEETLEKALGI